MYTSLNNLWGSYRSTLSSDEIINFYTLNGGSEETIWDGDDSEIHGTYSTRYAMSDYTDFYILFDGIRGCYARKIWYNETESLIYINSVDCWNRNVYEWNNVYITSAMLTFPNDGTKSLNIRRARSVLLKSDSGTDITSTNFMANMKIAVIYGIRKITS